MFLGKVQKYHATVTHYFQQNKFLRRLKKVVAVTYTMRGTKISIRSVMAVQLGVFLEATGTG